MPSSWHQRLNVVVLKQNSTHLSWGWGNVFHFQHCLCSEGKSWTIKEHSTPLRKQFWVAGLGFQKTTTGFHLSFYLGFAPFLFILTLTNSPVHAGDKHTHNVMLKIQYAIWFMKLKWRNWDLTCIKKSLLKWFWLTNTKYTVILSMQSVWHFSPKKENVNTPLSCNLISSGLLTWTCVIVCFLWKTQPPMAPFIRASEREFY